MEEEREDLSREEREEIEFLVAGLTEEEIKHYQSLKDSANTTPDQKRELAAKKIGLYKAIVEEMGYGYLPGSNLREVNWLFQRTIKDFPKIKDQKMLTIMRKMFAHPNDFYEKMEILDHEHNLRESALLTLTVIADLIGRKLI